MQFKETLNEGLRREYIITIKASKMSEFYSNAIADISKDVKIPGFRPGKAPANVIRAQFHDRVKSKILQDAIETNTAKLFKDLDFSPVEQPVINIESYQDDADLIYKVNFEVFPQIKPVDFSDIKLVKITADISDADIDNALSELAKGNKSYEKTTKKIAKENDALMIDYEGKVNDVAFDGGKGENHRLVLGSKTFIPGFEDQLIGAKRGETKIVKVTFPEDYHSKDLAGVEAEFTVLVHDILAAKDAIINDEFAKTLGFEDLSKLKDAILEKLKSDVSELSRTQLKKELFDKLEPKCDFEAPKTLIDQELKAINDNYNKATQQNLEAEIDKSEFDRLTTRRVKLGMLIAEIGKVENIQIAENDIKEAIMKQARQFPGREQMVFDYFVKNPKNIEALKGPIIEDKVVNYIFSKVEITENKIPASEIFDKAKRVNYNISSQLQELSKEWLEYLRFEKQYSNYSTISYNSDTISFFKFLNIHFGNIIDLEILKNIKSRDIRSWLASRHKFNNSSSRRALSAVKSFFKFLKKLNFLDNIIIENIKAPKKNIDVPRALLTEDSLESVNSIDSISSDTWIGARDKAILSLIYGCGLRISEVLNIKNSDIYNDYIKVYGKGKKERNIPFIDQVKIALNYYLNICPYNLDKNDVIFIGKQGKKLNPAVFQRQIRRLRSVLGISEHATPHAFRHSFASDILSNGADLRSIQELLGHESLSTTQRYTKINPTKLLEIYKKSHPKFKN